MIRSTALYVVKRAAWWVVLTVAALLFAYFSAPGADASGAPGRMHSPASVPAIPCTGPDEPPGCDPEETPEPTPSPTPSPTPTPSPEPSAMCVPACEVALTSEDRDRLDLMSGQLGVGSLLSIFFLAGILIVTGLRR